MFDSDRLMYACEHPLWWQMNVLLFLLQCIILCLSRSLSNGKDFAHLSHGNLFAVLCTYWCLRSVSGVEKDF